MNSRTFGRWLKCSHVADNRLMSSELKVLGKDFCPVFLEETPLRISRAEAEE